MKAVKKVLAALLLYVCPGLFALPLSAGGGFETGAGFELYRWDAVELSGSFVSAGPYGFFDFGYGETSLSVLGGFGTGGFSEGLKLTIGLDVLGKYPFPLRRAITLFPLVGFEAGYDVAVDFYMKLKAGGGLDWQFSRTRFLRSKLLYSGLLFSRLTLQDRDFARRHGMDYSSFVQGFAFQIGVGRRLR
ncbi:MAG: hypothetical protein MdMp014T_2383 [Treponematales bacterium]